MKIPEFSAPKSRFAFDILLKEGKVTFDINFLAIINYQEAQKIYHEDLSRVQSEVKEGKKCSFDKSESESESNS